MRLILNAVDAMPEGGALGIRAASEESGWVVVEVRDTGVGMSEETRRRLAERAREPAARAAGRATGSPDVADIVERHGGSVSIESEAGKGTVVRLRLHASRFQIIPASDGLAERQVVSRSRPRACSSWTTTRGCSPCSPTCCAASGHAVTTAAKGEEALAVCSTPPRTTWSSPTSACRG